MSINKLSLKRITALFIVIFVLFASFNELIPSIIAQNEDEPVEMLASVPNAKRFFGDQLGQEEILGTEESKTYDSGRLNQFMTSEKAIYNTLEKMRDDKIFLSGNIDCQISEPIYTEDKGLLMQAFAKARDAFKMDNPDLFYVDFDEISISVESGNTYLGIGRSKDYLLNGFTPENIPDAIADYEAKLDEIVSKARVAKTNNNSDDENIGLMNEITYVHDYIIENMMYKYENECTKTNNNGLCNHRTAYDGLINQEGVCEAYAKTFKAVLDRLDIPTICVYGLYKAKDSFSEEHLWNYVYWNNAWYGVDITHDDPVPRNVSKKSLLKTELENRDYFMVSETDLNIHHLPSGVVSSIDYIPFVYPGITLESQQVEKTLFNNDGQLKVKLNKSYYSEDIGDEAIPSGDVYVSYQGHSISWNEEHGKYLVCKLSQYQPGTDTWTQMDWAYITPELYPAIKEVEDPQNPDSELGAGYTKMPMPHIGKIQFAVTDVAPDTSPNGILKGGLYYKQDPYLLDSVTEVVENPWGTYIAPPYPKKTTPGLNGRLHIGQTYEIRVEYDDKLVPLDGENFDIDIDVSSYYDGLNTALENCEIKDKNFDNDRTITFKFTPSDMFNDDLTMYIFNIKGLVGETSKKRPIPISYVFAFGSNVGCSRVRASGGEYYAYGQPKLLANEDVSKNIRIKTDGSSDFETIDDSISHRLTLVATQTSQNKGQELKDFVQNEEDVNVKSCQTYNIQLNLCKKQVLMTGDRVKVCVGFPAGFSKNDAGTSFVAYHYKTDERGNIVDVEEIPCDVTEQGLVIWVNSFSPFMIAAVDKKDTDQLKTLSFDVSNGGKVIVDDKTATSTTTVKLNGNESKSIQITPDSGYKIGDVEVNGTKIQVNPTSYTLTISGNDKTYFPDQSAINSAQIGVNFITDEAVSHEQNRPTTQDNLSVTITPDEGTNVLNASVSGNTQDVTYQWYKNDQLIKDQVGPSLNLADDISKIGNYKVVTKINNSTTAVSASSSYEVKQPSEIYSVTFNPNGGEFDLSKIESNLLYSDSSGKLNLNDLNKINTGNLITRAGYTFLGWSTNKDSSTADITTDNLKEYTFKSNTTLYAIWQKNNNEYQFILDLTGTKLNVTNSDLVKTVEDTTLININNNVKYFIKNSNGLFDNLGNQYKTTPGAVKTGFEFSGWKTSDGQIVRNLNSLNTDTTITPTFGIFDDSNKSDQSYDIVLNPAEGILDSEFCSYELNKGDSIDLPLPIRDNYCFAGWYIENDTNHVQPIQKVNMDDNFINLHYKLNNIQTHSITLVAYWVPKEAFRIAIYPETIDGSSDVNNEIKKPGHVLIINQTSNGQNIPITAPNKGDVVTYKAYPSDGFRFKGWYKDGKPLKEVTSNAISQNDHTELTITFDPDITITAVFEPENTENSKEFKVSLIDNIHKENNIILNIKNGQLSGLPKVSDKNFVGWFTAQTGGEKVEDGFPIVSDLSLYAQYKTDNIRINCTVNPKNAGSVKGSGNYPAGTDIVLEASENEGYQFVNWTLNGEVISTDKHLSVKVESDSNYVANFSEDTKLDPDHQFSLENDVIYLTTLENGLNRADIKTKSKTPQIYEWSSSAPTVASIIAVQNDSIKIQALSEGVCFITVKSGNVIRTVKIIVSNNNLVTNTIIAHSKSPDEVTIEADGVMANPAIEGLSKIKTLDIFAWSASDQSDMNAKQISENENGNWSLTLPINDNGINNYFENANKIYIHIYAETDNGLEFIGSTVYNYSRGDYKDCYLISTPYAQDIGFITPSVFDDSLIGTEGESRQLEGIRLACPIDGVNLSYSVHMADLGWSQDVSEGTYAGSMGQNRQLEAIKISLTGENAQNYSLQYQAHVADKGWLDWVDAGQIAGTEGEARRLEAIRIKLVKK